MSPAVVVAQETADKSVYMQVSDDPIGQTFLLVLIFVVPVLAAAGVYKITEHAFGTGHKLAAVAVVIGWWLFFLVFVDIQIGHLVGGD